MQYIANKNVSLQFGESLLIVKEGDKVSEVVAKTFPKFFDIIGDESDVIQEVAPKAPVDETKEEILTEVSSDVQVTTETETEEETIQEIIQDAVDAVVEVKKTRKFF